jgi:hypothetical protein
MPHKGRGDTANLEVRLGRHSAPASAVNAIAFAAEPAPGSRRARLLAERAAHAAAPSTEKATMGTGAAFVATTRATDQPVSWPNRSELATSPTTETPISIHKSTSIHNSTSTHRKSSKFSLFTRSRAVTAAVVVVTSGVGTVAVTQSSSSAEPTTPTQTQSSAARETIAQEVATTFTVNVDGESQTVSSNENALGDALEESGILVNQADIVSSPMSAPVLNGSTITVTRVTTETVSETVTDAFTTTEVEDDTLAEGTTEVETEGQDGITTNTYEVTYQDGTEVSRVLTISAQTQARVDKVVRVGTKKAEAVATTSSSSSSSSSTSSSTSTTATATSTYVAPAGEAQQIAYSLIGNYGWGDDQFSCLVSLWNRESGWSVTAENASSGAYGIPQALPGSKMGTGWQTDATVQITWGLSYISGRYGTPCGAWNAFLSKGWY